MGLIIRRHFHRMNKEISFQLLHRLNFDGNSVGTYQKKSQSFGGTFKHERENERLEAERDKSKAAATVLKEQRGKYRRELGPILKDTFELEEDFKLIWGSIPSLGFRTVLD